MHAMKRAGWLGAAAGVAMSLSGYVLIALAFAARPLTTHQIVAVFAYVAVSSVMAGVSVFEVWRRVEAMASPPPPAWPVCEPIVRFPDVEPGALQWGPGLASPLSVIGSIEGQHLHRRFVLAALKLITSDFKSAVRDGLHLEDRGEPFVARVEHLIRGTDDLPDWWLITVRDRLRAGDASDSVAPVTVDSPPVTRPSVLAGVLVYTRRELAWEVSAIELHALDATYVNGLVVAAWQHAARKRDLPTAVTSAYGGFDDDGITSKVALRVPLTGRNAKRVREFAEDLLEELPIPLDVRAEGTLPDPEDA